ncbi:MAG: hypothetical protein LH609_22945, partial [Rudanella sp.]|nr:hypothetical protein [Rudanella sp.]
MRNVIGQAVSGDDFFDRPQLVNKIRRAIRNGNQIYLSAPRRVGKTSIMNYLMDNPGENEQFVYAITQSFRELMHNRKLTNKVQFVITGSIGLQPLVQKLAASDLINQLQFIDVPPL